MTGLQEAFYIIGIVYMGVSLLIIIGILIAIGVIRSKIVSLEHMVQSKISTVTNIGANMGDVISSVKKMAKRGK